MQKFTKKPLVLVEWDDISSLPKWEEEAECVKDDTIQCRTVGWKLKSRNNKNIIIASTRNTYGQYADRNVIPKSVIRKTVHLGEG